MAQNKLTVVKNVYDLIKETEGAKLKRFSKDQKVNFAYSFWNISNEDITDLYNFLAELKTSKARRIAREFADFMDNQSITKVRRFDSNFFDHDPEYIKQVTRRLKENGNWLSLYNIDREFSQANPYASPIIYSYLINNGETFTIDQNRASQVLGILTEANIPTAKCIVTNGFAHYANGDIDNYIKTLKK